jgi:predicted enzyme related to lactoylglutathione lyase
MGERTSHTPGSFSWVDLSTTDSDGAKAFYTALFGWELEENEIPGGGVYTMLQKDGRYVGALAAAQPGQPIAWNSYVTVQSADETVARARELGGEVRGDPFDVLEAGRMAAIHDPTGAVLAVWEPREHPGAALVNAPGALTLNQLNTSDPGRSLDFYSGLFEWRFEEVAAGAQPYWGIYNGERLNGGMMRQPPDLWLAYFGSESVDGDAGRIAELGGTVIVAPVPIPSGRILVAQDPQGAVFALFSGEFDD